MKDNKTQIDILIVDGFVLCIDDEFRTFYPGFVAISGARIVDVGFYSPEVRLKFDARETVSAHGCVVLPGLINAHTHIAMTLFRGLADDLPLMDWLQKYIFPAEKKLTEEWVYWGALLGCAEMIASGTTSFCDMYLFEHTVAKAVEKSGMRALLGEALYDFPSPNYGPQNQGLAFTERLVREWLGHERIRIAVEPHSVYTCSPNLLLRCRDLAERLIVPLVIHLSETREEVKTCISRYGTTPVRHLDSLKILDVNTIAAHCVHLEDQDIKVITTKNIKVVHNPQSNLKLSSGIAPVPKLISSGAEVALGTDGCASNNDLDMFLEMDTCAKIHKGVNLNPTIMSARDVLFTAIRGGARVLGLSDMIGQLKPGFYADIIVVDFDKPHLVPCYDPISHLVYSASGSDVRDVIIHGKWVYRNGIHSTINPEEIAGHVRHIAREIRS